MHSVATRAKTALGSLAVVGLVSLFVLVFATVALASFRLDYAPGLEPTDGVGVVGRPLTPAAPTIAALERGREIAVRRAAQAAVRPASGRVDWDALASCESSGDWSINTGNGYYGGVQMTHSNWLQHRPPGAPSHAHLATKAQQIHAAEGVLREEGRRAWPPLSRPECN